MPRTMDNTLIALIIFASGLTLFALIWYLIEISKRKKNEPLFCDACGSENLELESHYSGGEPENSTDHFTYTCQDCGNTTIKII